MDPLETFDADCRALGEALRARTVPRPERRACRALLQRAFLLRGDPEQPPPEVDRAQLEKTGEEIASALVALGLKEAPKEPEPFEPLGLRALRMWPIRIRWAVRDDFLEEMSITYGRIGARLQEGTPRW